MFLTTYLVVLNGLPRVEVEKVFSHSYILYYIFARTFLLIICHISSKCLPFVGCEGINHVNSTPVDPLVVYRNSELVAQYYAKLPSESFLTAASERSRFAAKADVIKSVSKSTR